MALIGARAEGPEDWASLYDGRLNQSMDRDPQAAIAVYETLLRGMPDGDPQRGELLYWLGRARLSAGDAAGAMETLRSAQAVWSSRSRSRALLGRLVALKTAVRQVPYDQDFQRGTEPWVRGWARGRDEDLAGAPGQTGRLAAWRTEVRDGEEDFLTFAVTTDGVAVRRILLSLQASAFPAVVQLRLEDANGVRWHTEAMAIPTESWTPIDLPLNRFAPEGGAAAILDGSELRWVSLVDVTAGYAEDRGENRLLIDDLALR
jgi:hypothetical protein